METRVAILMKKADQAKVDLPHDAAFFIAQKIRSNVRELEGALKKVIADSHFMGRAINQDFIRESLKDLLALQDKQVGVDNIQRTVAEYYKIKISDLHSKRRSRSVARPRQVAMALCQGADQSQLAGNRRCAWWTRPPHDSACMPAARWPHCAKRTPSIREDYRKKLLRLLDQLIQLPRSAERVR